MSVTRRGDSPFYVIDFIIKGRRYKKSSGTPIKAQAIAMEAEWKRQLREEEAYGPRIDITLGDAISRYLETVIAPRGRPLRTRQASNRYKQILSILPSKISVLRITEAHGTELKEGLLARGCSPGTINRYLTDLGALLTYCDKELGAVFRKPRLKKLKEGPRKTRVLTLEEEKRMLNAAPPGYRDMLILMLGTGARRTEAMTLKWTEVNLHTDKRSTVTFLGTKNGRDHTVPLPNHVDEMLRRRFAERPNGFEFVFYTIARFSCTGYRGLNPYLQGDPLQIRNPDETFRLIRARANLSDVTFHTLRHTYASRLVMAGVPIFEVCKLLNHSSVQMTMRYAHLSPHHLDGAVAKLDGIAPKTALISEASDLT